jgi:hypothetical protein
MDTQIILNIVACIVYVCSGIIYLVELLQGFRKDRPKVLSEWLWYIMLLIGGFVPGVNTIASYKIIKLNRKNGKQ